MDHLFSHFHGFIIHRFGATPKEFPSWREFYKKG